jgi:hypothetical protein
MKLPEAQWAVIAPTKIRDYLLSTLHPVGRFKAPFFASLGYTVANWQRLEQDMLGLAVSGATRSPEEKVRMAKSTKFRGTLNGPSGRSARVLTVWIVRFESNVPQFVTAFPGETK